MRFSLLGPLLAEGAGGQVAIAGPRLRVLLAALLLHANIPVPTGELAELVWDGSPPSGAAVTLRSNIRRLRSAVDPGGAQIAAVEPGYMIRVEQAELDVLEFEAHCRDARAALGASEWADASASAMRALGLWRAVPLLDVPAEALCAEFVPRLERLRLQVLEYRFDAGLRLGQHQELIPQLLDTTAQHPLQERFHAQLMLALASTGRRAQALHAYQQARRVLIDELGIEPGPELQGIHQRVLAGDTAAMTKRADAIQPGETPGTTLTSAQAGSAGVLAAEAPVRAPAAPAQLPADTADFTGREAQAAYLRNALASHNAASRPGVVRVVVVAGPAGFGKTTLAVHAAHQVRDLFPDGQLYVHLSGASSQPAAPNEVLTRLLRDLCVDNGKIPEGEEERAALYRTRLTGRRVLIVLDDARDAAQVRPLLPGSASCAVVVTTRNRAPDLLNTGLVDLEALPEAEALELFSRVVGDGRPAAEPQPTAEVLSACAGLPLAVRICAARLAVRRQWPVATMAARLRDERCRLDELQAGDLEVRASFQVSYDSLGGGRQRADPARIFRLLGLWQGQRISLPAAAALSGERAEDVAGALEELVDASLLESPEPDWYQLHDLLRLFAIERAQAEETREARHEAVSRLLQWYLATAAVAADLLSPHRYRTPEDDVPPPGPPPGSATDALAWYDGERENVIAAIRQAAAAGLPDLAWRLPAALFPLFFRRHDWAACVTAHRIAVSSARTAGLRKGEARALQNLGGGLAAVGEMEAFACLEEASAIWRETGDLVGEAQTTISITFACYKLRGPQEAYGHSLRGLELLRNAGNPALLGLGLSNHGDLCRMLGRADEGTECLREALAIWTAIGRGSGQANALENLGRIYLESGRLHEAIASLSEAHRLQVAEGHLEAQAVALRYLGEAQHRTGQTDQARESLEAALALFKHLKAETEIEDTHYALSALAQAAGPAAP